MFPIHKDPDDVVDVDHERAAHVTMPGCGPAGDVPIPPAGDVRAPLPFPTERPMPPIEPPPPPHRDIYRAIAAGAGFTLGFLTLGAALMLGWQLAGF